jgi:hypothetical protein
VVETKSSHTHTQWISAAGDIIKHSVKKNRAQPSELGNMLPNAQNEAENDEETKEESLVGVDKISDLAEGDNLEQFDSKLTEEALKHFGLQPESNIPAEPLSSGTGPLYKYLRSKILTAKMCQVTDHMWIRDKDISGELGLKAKDEVAAIHKFLALGASDKFIQLLSSHLEPCLIRMVRGDMVGGSNTMMATMTLKKVKPDVICGDELDKAVFSDDEAMAKVDVHDTGGYVVEILFPELIQESLPSHSSAESGPWAKVIEYTHMHAQHSPYDTVTWQKQVVKGATGSGTVPLYKYL